MTRRLRFWTRVVLLCVSASLFQFGGGCNRILTQELEVLVAPAANESLIYNSYLVERFGMGILRVSHLFDPRYW